MIAGLTPFLVSRQVITGSGRVGIGPSGDEPGFQLSQRSDYIEVEVGLETTLKRGIINTRDEPHADADKYRRLHVIIGDANLVGDLDLSQARRHRAGARPDRGGPPRVSTSPIWRWPGPVHAVHVISRDPSLRATVALADGRELTALALQRIYLDRVAKLVDSRDPDPRAGDVVETWAHVLDLLERDPMECAEILDWPAKLRLLEGFRHRENLSWSAPRLHLVDLQYSDVRLDKGLYNRLVARGSMKRLVTEQQVLRRGRQPADRHPRLLPRRVPASVRCRHRRRQLGLGDLRPRRRFARPDSDPGAAAWQQGPRRSAAGLGGQRRRTGRTAHQLDALSQAIRRAER